MSGSRNNPHVPPPDHADVVIITVIMEELSAVREILGLDRIHSEDRDYYWGEVQGAEARHIVVCANSGGMGNVPAAKIASDVIERWNPKILLVVGIAGAVNGRDQISLGDVIIHDDLLYYELQKIVDGEHYEQFMQVASPSWILLQASTHIALEAVEWYKHIGIPKPDQTHTPPKMHHGLILSGDKLLADPNSEELKRLLQRHDRALAVEMESGGIARVAWEKHSTHPLEFLIIRGVSDYCNAQGNQETRDQWRIYAARAAAAFALELIQELKEPMPRLKEAMQRGKESESDKEVASSIAGLDVVKLALYCVVGKCVRYEEDTRRDMINLKEKILNGLTATTMKHENYLIWAPSGSGKTFFVTEIAANAIASYCPIDLTQEVDEKRYRIKLDEAQAVQGACICFIDEIDKGPNEKWLYDALLKPLLRSGKQKAGHVFILAGSSGSSLNELIERIKSRDAGRDVITRVEQNEYSIPPMTPLDRVLVAISSITQCERPEHPIRGVEKMALYYIIQNKQLGTARQVDEFIKRSLDRVASRTEWLSYDHLFDPSDKQSHVFWSKAHEELQGLCSKLVNKFVVIDKTGFAPPLTPSKSLSKSILIPRPLTPVVGRTREVDDVSRQLTQEKVRLLTLTGPAYVGKTALAIQVAWKIVEGAADAFTDGVCFIDLASLSDPNLVVSTIATKLRVKEVANKPLLTSLQTFLRKKRILLILDNFEQVIDAKLQLKQVLEFCPNLTVIVTSRETLHIHGEHEYPVLPLEVPDLDHLPSVEELKNIASIALFVQLAKSVKADFEVTKENAHAVAAICVQRDGVPGRIEWDAPLVKTFTPQTIQQQLQLHRKLHRDPNEPSYDRLEEPQKKLFRCLAIFTGGFSYKAAQTVCDKDHDLDIWENLRELVEKNLLKCKPDEVGGERFSFLNTTREFALDCLKSNNTEWETVSQEHARFFLEMAEVAELELRGAKEVEWLRQLELERANLRAALHWFIESKENEQLVFGLRMPGALGLFWDICHYWSEGRVLLDTALERAPAEPTIARAKALRWAGRLAASQNDYTVAHVRLEKSLTISRQLGDKKGIAWSLCYLANIAMHAGDWINCHELLDESLPLFREPPQDELGIAHCLRIEAWMSQSKGEYDCGPSLLQESVEIYRKLGFKTGLAWSLKERVDSLVHFTPGITADNYDGARSVLLECLKFADELADRLLTCEVLGTLGDLERFNGNYEAAAELYKQNKSLADELDSKISIAFAYLGLGHIMLYQGNYREAHEVFKRSITLFHTFGEKFGVVSCLFGFGAQEAKRASGSLARAVQLFSAAERQRQDMNVLSPVERREYDLILSQVQAKLSTEEFEAAWTKGKSMKLDEAVEYVLGK